MVIMYYLNKAATVVTPSVFCTHTHSEFCAKTSPQLSVNAVIKDECLCIIFIGVCCVRMIVSGQHK